MIRKILFYLSVIFLLFITVMGIFPTLFTNRNPTEKHIPKMPGNNGENTVTIYNNSNRPLDIDSLIIYYLPDVYGIIDNKTIIEKNSNKTVTFVIHNFITENLDCSKLEVKLFSYSKNLLVDLQFNKQTQKVFGGKELQPRYYNLIENEDGYHVYIPKYEFIKKGDNRFLEKSLFGTDSVGYDIWSLAVYGATVVVKIVFISTLISFILGTFFGLIRGYYNNFVSKFIGILSNLGNSVSIYLVTIMIVSIFGRELIIVIITFSFVQWIEIEKIIYERVLVKKKEDYIKTSVLFGKTDFQIIFTDILPFCYSQIVIGSVFLAKRIMLIESSLSFLNYSVKAPYSSWGKMINSAAEIINSPLGIQIIIIPTLFIILTALSLDRLEFYFRQIFQKKERN